MSVLERKKKGSIMDLANSVGGIEKLNETNYVYWKSCMESYLQGQDLLDVVNGTEVAPVNGEADAVELRRK